MRRKTETQRHAMDLGIPRHVVSEMGGGHGGSGNAVVFDRPGKFGETRRTAVSRTHTKDNGAGLLLDLLP